jgi:hypothetical protein
VPPEVVVDARIAGIDVSMHATLLLLINWVALR